MSDQAEAAKRPGEEEIQSRVKRLKQQFGRHLDPSVLEAVLEMHDFDYKQAEAFLQAENQEEAVDLQNYDPKKAGDEDALPKDYFTPLPGWEGVPKAQNAPSTSQAQEENPAQAQAQPPMELKELFTRQSTYQEHYTSQRERFVEYLGTLVVLAKNGMELKDSSKARCLAALWAQKRFRVADYLLGRDSNQGRGFGFGLPEVLKAVTLLDSNRRIRVLEKRASLLHRQAKVRQATLGKVTAAINNLRKEPVQGGSLSGALARRVKAWLRQVPAEELRFYSIHLPREPWKELSDLLHPNPARDLQEPWFLPVAFGEPAPAHSIAAASLELTPDNILAFVAEHSPPYAFLRRHRELLSRQVLAQAATYTPLEVLLWFYEEVRCEEVDDIITTKLRAGEELKMGYGKLMERLLALKALGVPFLQDLIPAAEAKLQEVRVPLQPPVACFGDASYSMDVAIRVSTIIASLLTAMTKAELRFFNTEAVKPPKLPRTIEDVLDLTVSIRADKLTAPAAALREFYDQKIPINTFILVTDEVENIPHEGDYFAQLFCRYRREVQPQAQVVFVSFLPNQNARGRMVRALEAFGITPRLEVRLDGARPDLTKLDSMLAQLSTETEAFKGEVREAAARFAGEGWADHVMTQAE